MQQIDLLEAFKYDFFLLKIAGAWSYQRKFWYKIYKHIIVWLVIVHDLALLAYIVFNFREKEVVDSIYSLPAMTQGSIKFFMFQKNFKHITETLDILQQGICQPKNEAQMTTIDAIISSGKKLVSYYSGLVVFLCGTYCLRPLSMSGKNLPTPAWLPFDFRLPIVFESVYFFSCFVFIQIAVVNVSADSFICISMMQIGAQCDLLGDTLMKIKEMAESVEDHGSEEDKMKKILIECVYHYNLILKYAKLLAEAYKQIVMAQFVCSVISICSTMYQLSLAEPASQEFFQLFFFQAGVTIEIFFYCYFGNRIIERSEALLYATFESKWIDASKNFKRDLFIFMNQLQNPIVFYAWNIFPINLATFKGIMQKSWSFFMALTNTQNIHSHDT